MSGGSTASRITWRTATRMGVRAYGDKIVLWLGIFSAQHRCIGVGKYTYSLLLYYMNWSSYG